MLTSKMAADEIYDLFKTKAQGVGAEVHRFGTVADTAPFLLPLLKELNVADLPGSYALCGGGRLAALFKGSEGAKIPGVKLEVTRELAADALVGLSEVQWGLADTGSVVQDQSAVEERLVSSLPAVHIALIGTKRILPDKIALLSRIDPRKMRFIAFITGPSRTADIERVLTIGVHGPKRLIVLVVDDLEGGVR